jgi:hypothetical protein
MGSGGRPVVYCAFVVRIEVKGDASVLQCRISPRSCDVQPVIVNQELQCLFWRKSVIVSPYVMDCKTFTTLYYNMCCRSLVSVSGSVTTLRGVLYFVAPHCPYVGPVEYVLCKKHKGNIHHITDHEGPQEK